jgi:uncharacterized protein (UPF0264 family)
MIGFEEMNEFDQQQVMLDVAIRDAMTNLKFIAEHRPESLFNVLNELDELMELAGKIAENGIRAVGMKMERE